MKKNYKLSYNSQAYNWVKPSRMVVKRKGNEFHL